MCHYSGRKEAILALWISGEEGRTKGKDYE
jgi:hypothetical protein